MLCGMTTLVLATRNQHKVTELRDILRAAGMTDVDLRAATSFPDVPDVVETGLTFAENSLLKARAVAAATGLPAIADDSGICVSALHGMPGVFSARWSGRHGDDEANLRLLLAQISEVPDEHRGAHFACAAAAALPEGAECVTEGRVDGYLIREPRGAHGFGYDPIFVPDGETRTTAEMSPAEKNAISHRARAFRALVPALIDMIR
jgi:XTP/dITP diphosphohydrolase